MNTPRTEKNRIPNSDLSDWGVGLSDYVDVEFSRNLELELNEAKAEIKLLQDWKDSQMAVESEWDAQMLAKALGAPIGSSCRKEIQKRTLELIAENKRLTELLDANTVHSCGDHCQRPTCKQAMRNAIKDAHWQLLAFLKPGDEKTKEIIEMLQKFL